MSLHGQHGGNRDATFDEIVEYKPIVDEDPEQPGQGQMGSPHLPNHGQTIHRIPQHPTGQINPDRLPPQLTYPCGKNPSATTDIQTRPNPTPQPLLERTHNSQRVPTIPLHPSTSKKRALIPFSDLVIRGMCHCSIRAPHPHRIDKFSYEPNPIRADTDSTPSPCVEVRSR